MLSTDNRICIATLLSALACLAPAGCYNPELGDNPFTCSLTNPKDCPEGYICWKPKAGHNGYCVKELPPDMGPPDQHVWTDKELWEFYNKDGSPLNLDLAFVKEAPITCDDYSEEPNNWAVKATDITAWANKTASDWEICYPGDIDQFSFKLASGKNLTITVKFTHSKGDLEALLLDPTGSVIDEGRGVVNNETVSTTGMASTGGRYILGVYGYQFAMNTYDLIIEVK